jgi:hypothetical protein
MCAEWHAARAQQLKNWADYDLATGWGTMASDNELDLEPLGKMQELEFHLSRIKPRSVLLARQMLGIVRTILADRERDPEATLADGPVLEFVRNALSSLEWLPGETKLGPVKRDELN